MKIMKYLHSCLIVETNGVRKLFDPGKFSFFESKVYSIISDPEYATIP